MLQELSDSTTQTNEMQNSEEEVIILKSKVKELVQQLENGNSEKETLKKTLESKVEQQDKKIKVVYVGIFIVTLKVMAFKHYFIPVLMVFAYWEVIVGLSVCAFVKFIF
jgi:predicted ribosome-associated RNA-binding protein Tma20